MLVMRTISKLIFESKTIESLLDANRGIGPGFDHLRLALALLIFNVHASAVINGRSAQAEVIVTAQSNSPTAGWDNWRAPIYIMFVPMFFALSGFLVSGSALRLRDLRRFIGARMLRIIPALFIEVCLSAVAIGPIFTTLTLSDYFLNQQFFSYFGNIVGHIQYELPGVFLNNPIPRIVNNSLWTLPVEFYCYIFMTTAMISGLIYDKRLFLVFFVVATIATTAMNYRYEWSSHRGNYTLIIILYYFLCGCIFYLYRNVIKISFIYVLIAVVLAYALIYTKSLALIAPLFLTYVTIGIGMLRLPKIPVVSVGDYSYGVYLYGFPISQSVIALLPAIKSSPLLFKATAIGITFGFAYISWNVIEKKALLLKHKLQK